VRVSIVRGGGVAGITTHTELDSAQLHANDAADLHRLAGAATLDEPVSPAGRGPDELQYEIAVDDDAGHRSARYSESGLPDPVRTLIGWIDTRPETTTRVAPA
jgi:hypothetical protein